MATLAQNEILTQYARYIWIKGNFPVDSKVSIDTIVADIKSKAATDKIEPIAAAEATIKTMGFPPFVLPEAAPAPPAKPAKPAGKSKTVTAQADPEAGVNVVSFVGNDLNFSPRSVGLDGRLGPSTIPTSPPASTAIVPAGKDMSLAALEDPEGPRVRALAAGESWRDVLGEKLGARIEIPWEVVQEELLREYVSIETASSERYTLRIRPGPCIACNASKPSEVVREGQGIETYVPKYYIYTAEVIREKGARPERILLAVNATAQKKLPAFIGQHGVDAWFKVKATREQNTYRVEIQKVEA